jgi:hypothetical protein
MEKYIIRNNKKLIVGKPRKLTLQMKPKDLAPEYSEIQYFKNKKWRS